jgi:glycosyltransferase involved in cell wall biosynthesis
MKIVIDGRMYQESGIGRYIRNLILQLQKLDKTNEYYILHLKKDFHSVQYEDNFQKVMVDFRWYTLQEQVKLPKILNKIKPDLVHFPHFNVPVFYSGKYIVTIHDLIHQHFVMKHATTLDPVTFKLKQFGYRKAFSSAVNKSTKLITPSQFVKDQLIKEWNVNGDKIMVTPEGVDSKLLTATAQLDKTGILKKFNINPPYIFYVGNAHPHKNIDGLINAFLKLRQNYQYLQLVLTGKDNFFWQKIKADPRFQNINIIYTGYVNDSELADLYKAAQVYVEPSFEEGFGIPLLEAMSAGCPVVSSDAGSLKEVGAEAAIYFDPRNIDEMVDKITQVLNSEKLRKELTEKGKKRVNDFSWEKMAKQTLEVYNSV